MRVLEIKDIKELLSTYGYKNFILELMDTLEEDYKAWESFDKCARVANHVDGGVIELMPISNEKMYSFKYVNGHPKNPKENKFTVMATGQLSLTSTGEPLMFSEMTILTALRTSANSALAAKYLAKKDSKVLALIGTGSQSEFQYLAFSYLFNLEELRIFDVDEKAMDKFERNIAKYDIKVVRCKNAREASMTADIITTCTADKKLQTILTKDMINKDVYINAIGGDCPGKTELESALVKESKVVVEYLPQSKVEGEIQHLGEDFTCPELTDILNGKISLNVEKDGTIVFDSVGFALEDYSVLRLVYKLAQKENVGKEMELIPNINDVKDLFSLV